METLESEFAQAVRNVSIHGEKRDLAIAAHTEVRELLEADAQLSEWGIDTILIGSYARQTSRYPGKDVDVFLRFMQLTARHSPEKIYNEVDRVLVAKYGLKDEVPGGRVTRQARSLKIDFPHPDDAQDDKSFSIDAVPAIPWQNDWGIPNRDRNQWDSDNGRWIRTNPVKFAADTNSLATASTSPMIGDTNAYRPIGRLLRQVRHTHLGEDRPGGLFTEIAAYYAWSNDEIAGDSWAELLASTLARVAVKFEEAIMSGLMDPVLGTPLRPALEPWQWSTAAQKFAELAELAQQALASDRCKAAKIWRDILGVNDRGQILPLPDGCDAAGFSVDSISAVGAVGSNQPRGFAAVHASSGRAIG